MPFKVLHCLTFFVLLISVDTAFAELVFTITGDDSDSVVDWSLSGSVTVNQSIVAQNNNDLLFPTLDLMAWDHLANVGTDGIVSTKFIGHSSISGSPTISINGGSNLFAGIGLNNVGFVNNASGDSFQFLFDGFAVHPALSVGDSVTYGGSGAIDLGAAKSTIFVDGVYVGEQLLHDSDRIKLIVQSQAVPEPTSLAAFLAAIGCVLFRRKRAY